MPVLDVKFEEMDGILCLVVRVGETWLATPFSELNEENASDKLEALKRSVVSHAFGLP